MFSNWLKQVLLLLGKQPFFWLIYVVLLYPVLAIGSLSQLLGIILAVISLFVGVGLGAFCDQLEQSGKNVTLTQIIRQCLPLSIIAGIALMLCWFVFRAIADLTNGQFQHIVQFFWQGDLIKPELWDKPWQIIVARVYEVSMVALIFSVLMITTFANWFSFPLMVFNNYRWSIAKNSGIQSARKNQKAMSNLMLSLGISTVLGLSLFPVLTPIFYLLTSLLMYVSYRQIYGRPFEG